MRATPTLGVVYRPGHFDVPVRRVLLPRTRHHVYYAVEQHVVVVLSVWGAQQLHDSGLWPGRDPRPPSVAWTGPMMRRRRRFGRGVGLLRAVDATAAASPSGRHTPASIGAEGGPRSTRSRSSAP